MPSFKQICYQFDQKQAIQKTCFVKSVSTKQKNHGCVSFSFNSVRCDQQFSVPFKIMITVLQFESPIQLVYKFNQS